MSKAPSFSKVRVDGATFRKADSGRVARRGQTLVLFAMLCFALLGLAALIIDVGYARLARLQMQSATDGAALEALRFRDDFPLEWLDGNDIDPSLKAELDNMSASRPATTQTVADPDWIAWRNEARRIMARRQVRNVFDDDFQSDSIPNNYGAGPDVGLDGGVGDPELYAGQDISVADEPVYKPQLQLNMANEQHGDVVSGSYQSANVTTNPELADYTRTDYDPSGANYDDAALVRLRRSNETYGPDGDGIASNGPPVPYLFGRGSLMNRQSIGNGITVRATSIAAAGTSPGGSTTYGRVMSAGPAIPASRIRGLTPFALSAAYWRAAFWSDVNDTPGTDTLTVINGNQISSAKYPGVSGVTGANPTVLLSIGDTYVATTNNLALSSQPSPDDSLYAFVPVYDQVGGNPYVVIAFGFVQWDPTTATLSRPFDDGRLIEVVAQGNASAVPTSSANMTAGVLTAHRLSAVPLVAPVLVNSQ